MVTSRLLRGGGRGLLRSDRRCDGSGSGSRLSIVVGQGLPKPAATKVCGMMEVIAPKDGFLLGMHVSSARRNGLGKMDAMKLQKNKQNGRMHVFGPKEVIIEHGEAVSRRNALAEIGRATDSKMSIKLQDCIEEVEEEEEEEVCQNQQLRTDLLRLNHEIQIIETRVKSEVNDEEMKNPQEVEKMANNEVSTEAKKEGVDKENADEKSSDSSDDENFEQSDDVIGKRVAPLQLMGEFLKAIMEQKYSLAKKLCQMILIYEPENPEARQFLPLIEQKLLLERERERERQDEEGEESESSSDDSDDSSDTEESEASAEDSDKNS